MNDSTVSVSKPRFLILDGLRGVAALMVLGYHLFEAIAFAAGSAEQQMFHGFLAVDFFLILSGFVMGYAYDSEWDRMSFGCFVKKRLVRLHPMVVMGVAIGLIVFVAQGALKWDGTRVSWTNLLVCTIMSLFLLPSPLGVDVRGNTEMFPLNGPHWSLFFEYIGSILYALLLRRLSTGALKIWVALAGIALLSFGIWGPTGNIACGWSSVPDNALGGLLRMTFDYPMGLLLVRLFKEHPHKKLSGRVFLLASALLIAALCVPAIGAASLCYEILCVTIIFPAIIWLGAKGEFTGRLGNGSMSFLANLSYPLYAIHYPFIYMYIGWINSGTNPFGPYPWCTPLAISVITVVIAILCWKYYDKPVRNFIR